MIEVFEYLRTHGWFTFWLAWFAISILGMVFNFILEIVKIFAEKDLRVLIGKKIDLEIAKAKAELEKIEYDLEGTQDD